MTKRVSAAKASTKKNEIADDDGSAAPSEAMNTDAASKVRTVGKASAKATSGKAADRKVATVTLADIGDHLAATFDIPKSHAKIYLAEAVAMIGKQLKRGAKVRLSSLGTLQVKKRAARKARNPNTGEEVKVKAGRRVVFAASQDLKSRL